jgi:hypothetical protein
MKLFITLDSYDEEFVVTLQNAVKHKTGYRPVVAKVIRAVLRDYRQLLERRSDPDFLAAYRAASLSRRGGRGTGRGEYV